jgi:hypothetical protein
MTSNLWKLDSSSTAIVKKELSREIPSALPSRACAHQTHDVNRTLQEFTKPEHTYNSVVNMARILVAGGVRDRAIERTVKAAAAAAAAAAATSVLGMRADSATWSMEENSALPSLSPSRSNFSRFDAFAKHSAAVAAGKLPDISSRKSSCKGTHFKRSSSHFREMKNTKCELHDTSELRVRSISVPLCIGSTASSPADWLPPSLKSASPSKQPVRSPPQFKQTFQFEDNDLCAPFRQDLSIKRPVLNMLAPTDAAAEKLILRQSVLLQQALKQSNLLGPGHTLVPSGKNSSEVAQIGTAISTLAKQMSTRPPPETVMKRNFALT